MPVPLLTIALLSAVGATPPWTAAEHTQVRLLAATGDEQCVPACRSGFICLRGACTSACNPPCATGESCTSQGECVPQGAPVPAPAPVSRSGLTREQIYREIEQQRDLMPGTGGLKALIGINAPFFLIALVGVVIDLVFLGFNPEDRGGELRISLIICAIVGVGTGTATVLGIVLLALRAREAEPYQRRIDELNEMLRAPTARAGPPPVRPGVVLARF